MTRGVFALRTFRQDGSSVTTPMWLFPTDEPGGRKWVGHTSAHTGKVRRLHDDPRADVAMADTDGTPTGPWHAGTARITSPRFGLASAVFRLVSWRRPAVTVDITLHDPLDELPPVKPRGDPSAGFVLSAIPPAVLVPVNAAAGWVAAVICAGLVAVGIAAARIAQGHPRGQALGGIVGVAISGFFAWHSGSGSGLFLPDIGWELLAITVLTGSLLIRRPLVGVVWRLVDPGRTIGSARGRFDVATAGWAAVFVVRFVVTQWLSADPADPLAVTAKIISGLPLTLLAFALTAWAWRGAGDHAPGMHRYAPCGPRAR